MRLNRFYDAWVATRSVPCAILSIPNTIWYPWCGAGGPTGMIFVRSRGGISHSEIEDSAPEDLAAGSDVLLRTALALAG